MSLLAISWDVVGVKVGQLLLSLSILVILHEFGHYITARWFGCRVERFFLFFDPWFSLFKKKVGDTVYGIGWLPLGGYVKISGMIDESMDKEQLALPPEPWEFRSKPAWQRLIIMIGGVTVNILLAFIIYAGILMVWGEKKIVNASLKYGIEVQDSLMLELGFKDGDKVVALDGKPVENYYDVIPTLILSSTATIERNGQQQTLTMPRNLIGKLVEKKRRDVPLIGIRYPMMIGADTGVSARYGWKRFDKVIAINGKPTAFFTDAVAVMEQHKNKQVNFTLLRNADTLQSTVQLDSTGYVADLRIIGKPESLEEAGVVDYEVIKYGFFAAIPAGIRMAGDKLSWYIDQFKMILSPETEAYKGVGGFKAMGNVFPGSWDWESFWTITAFFSIVLAFMNLLPIPALDGGHVLFTLVEMITGRKPNQKFLEYAQVVGMVLLLGLMLYANGNDWLGWGRGK
ncbi:MAG: RIP metalloprotease RseP [Bacteroidetes bacterium]|jgi:regulator of sigma E protease|uniref:RIP metalloprotease RseP n=1 Tax=Phnomibacter sp. TaxID=2836217 RepID=UPI002FDEB8F9|nr:RIP metalloprotease RseP [Bacteroidota bacterium]